MITKEDLYEDFQSEQFYKSARDDVKELLDRAYEYGFEDGVTEAHVVMTKFNDRVADQLRGLAYDLENPG